MVAVVSGAVPVRAQMVDADAVTLRTIEGRLNEAGVCTSLAFDLRVVSALVGFPIPSFIPIDTNLRWNQSRHTVTRFASTPTEVRLDFEMGCQPGSNGAVLEFIGLEPKDVRLADAVACTGERAGDGSLETLVCTPEGRIGRFLSKTMMGLSAKVGRLLPMNLAVPVSEVVAPFGPTRPADAATTAPAAADPLAEPDALPAVPEGPVQPPAAETGDAEAATHDKATETGPR